ncbi:MAG: hypothetical protein ACOY0T_00270 [Myxococcota bacterium]
MTTVNVPSAMLGFGRDRCSHAKGAAFPAATLSWDSHGYYEVALDAG